MEFRVEHDGCISCGYCVDTCPEVFRFADDGLAEAYAQPEDDAVTQRAEDCVEGCPVNVISYGEG